MLEALERTLVLIKPDGLQRGIALELLSQFERRGLRLVGLKLVWPSQSLAEQHYAEHRGKPFYAGLVSYITSQPVVAAVFEGPRAIEVVRTTMGITRPHEAAPGTIRGDYGITVDFNLAHGSANADDAKREVALWFRSDELLSYSRAIDSWLWR